MNFHGHWNKIHENPLIHLHYKRMVAQRVLHRHHHTFYYYALCFHQQFAGFNLALQYSDLSKGNIQSVSEIGNKL